MPVKFKEKHTPDRITPPNVIFALVQNFIQHTYRTDPFSKDKENLPKKMNLHKDAFSVWFSKVEIDNLFKANIDEKGNPPTGLRIYLGMHGNSVMEKDANKRHPKYKGQYTTILVCTKDDKKGVHQDILTDDKYFTSDSTFDGMGADEGHIVPPPYNETSGCKILPK